MPLKLTNTFQFLNLVSFTGYSKIILLFELDFRLAIDEKLIKHGENKVLLLRFYCISFARYLLHCWNLNKILSILLKQPASA